MHLRYLFTVLVLVLGATLVTHPALARKKNKQVSVKVIVKDEEGEPIPTAIVRHPEEAERHRVNAVEGSWEADVLYMPDGSELVFTPGMTLELEISAPGYVTQVIQYEVRRRNNKIPVTLKKLELESEEIEEPMLQFGRDRPREVGQGTPAN